MILELEGLAIFGRHGVLEEERRDGQEFLYDIRLDVGDAGVTDRIEDAVDYRRVADCVREVSDSRSFNLIEALATAVVDALIERFPVRSVRLQVTKTNPAGVGARHAIVSVERASAKRV
jgi:7,8-dihydroneopterin aldolase/epimerase/oxygenase